MENRGQRKPWKAYLLLMTAAVTCPCHLPLILAILGGTALAGVLRENLFLTLIGLTAYFLVALAMGLTLLERGPRR
ncbi:MAG: mercury resistance protein [candidate division NC10 bacterium]|nr:mercury resistance protein [candidate division NC10 bacterium]